jgi:hypothetical protein
LLASSNFTAASVGGAAVATQPYVTSRGYLTSSGSIAYANLAGNSASLGGVAASAYALLSSANFNAASVGGSAIATIPYITSQGYLNSSGSIAYATYAASAGSAPAPASVQYSASSGVSASLSGFNSNSYALLASANFTSASISGSALATQAYVLDRGYQTTSGSVSYAASAGYAPTPASVTYSASSGISASLSGFNPNSYALLASANFTSASVGGAAVATQPYINSLGFLTSSGSIAYANLAGNSASLNGIPASSYVQTSQLATASVLYAQTAGNSSGTALAIADEGSLLTSSAKYINFTGAGVTTSNTSGSVTVTIAGHGGGGGGGGGQDSASLGGLPASAYALLASANFTSASISGSALATQSFVTSQGYAPLLSPSFNGTPLAPTAAASVNNNQIATASFVKQLVYPQTLTFTVSGALSTAGPWNYKLYNDTGQNRIITGVRASVGTPAAGSNIVIDVLRSGSTIFTNSGFTLGQGLDTTGRVTGFNSGSTVLTTDYLTVALKQVGSTNSGSNLVVQIMWT